MRIGIFTDSYYPHISGVSTSIKILKEGVEAMGHKVFIVAPNLDNNKFIYDKKNKIIYLPGIKTGLYKLKITEFYSQKAMKIIKNDWCLDVIHSQSEFGIGYFSRIVAKKLNLPVVHTYHTLYDDYTHYIFHGHFNKAIKRIVYKLTTYYCDKNCDELIVPTDKIKELFKNKYQITRKMSVIPTGIDIKKFYKTNTLKKKAVELRKKYNIKSDDFIIGSVGRVAAEKSFDKTLYTLVDLIKINNKIKFMLIGDGPEIDNIKNIIKKLKLEKNVILTGLIDYELIPAYYQVFNVMVSFSKTETQGLTIIEGLAASLPVVCVDDYSFRSMVQNNYNGFLFNSDDEYQKYILSLVNNKELYKTISMNAKNSVYSYSKEVFASRVLKVYHEAIEKKAHKSP